MCARRSTPGEHLQPRQNRNAPARRTLIELRTDALAGSQTGATHLFNELKYEITRWLRRRLPYDAADDVDDYTQEALWRIWTHLCDCQAHDERGIRAWALTIAWRVAVADRRRRVRTIPLHDESVVRRADGGDANTNRSSDARDVATRAFMGGPPDGDIAVRSWHPVLSLARDVSAAELLARMASDAQRQLPISTQELLYARLIERLSWRELGRQYGITAPAARRRYQRAQKSLRRYVLEGLGSVSEPRRSQAVIWLSVVSATPH